MRNIKLAGGVRDIKLTGGVRNIKLTIEYDGTEYVGWQRQPSGRTVQEEIERALEAAGVRDGQHLVVYGSNALSSARAWMTRALCSTARARPWRGLTNA